MKTVFAETALLPEGWANEVLVSIGADPANTRNLANIYVRLSDVDARDRDQFAVMAAVRDEVLPPLTRGMRTSVQPVATIGGRPGSASVAVAGLVGSGRPKSGSRGSGPVPFQPPKCLAASFSSKAGSASPTSTRVARSGRYQRS